MMQDHLVVDLNIQEVCAGLMDKAYSIHHLMLLQRLCNLCADRDWLKIEDDSISIFRFLLDYLFQLNEVEIYDANFDLALLALSNLTVSEDTCSKFIIVFTETDAEYSSLFSELLENFFKTSHIADDIFQHVGSILCNITQLSDGRSYVLRQSKNYVPRLVLEISSSNIIRRKGCVGSLRNCLFDKDVHWWMIHDVDLLNFILPPLVVATPFTDRERLGMSPELVSLADNPEKMPETDIEVVIMLLDSIVLLCQRRGIRQDLRKRKVYPICRNLDYFLENERVSDIVFEIVNFLERDDDPSEPIDSYDNPQPVVPCDKK